jgi:hypothetical protein
MTSVVTDGRSQVSNKTQKIIEDVAAKTTTRIYSLEGIFNDEEVRVVWNAFGLYVSRNLRMGRAVAVPRLGLFTFTAPEVNLHGVTNPEDRNRLPRCPVFIIAKEFVKGRVFTPGIQYHQEFGRGIRPFSVNGVNGEVPQTKVNLVEIGSYANMDKEKVALVFQRIIKQLSELGNAKASFDMEIPNVGTLRLRKNIVACSFNEFLMRDTRSVLTESIDARQRKGHMLLTHDNLQRLSHLTDMRRTAGYNPSILDLDENAKRYLSSEFGIEENPAPHDRRTITGLDRSLGFKPFKTQSNFGDKKFATSTFEELRKSGLTNFSLGQTRRQTRTQFNFALRALVDWIR